MFVFWISKLHFYLHSM